MTNINQGQALNGSKDGSCVVFLIRHGQVAAQHWDTMYGTMDVELSERGKKQSENYARFVSNAGIDFIISSPLSRAQYGARKIAETTFCNGITINNGFLELDRGSWTGFSNKYVKETYPDLYDQIESNPYFNEHNGESFETVAKRVVLSLKKLIQSNSGKNFCVVAHYYVIKAILLVAQKKSLEKMANVNVPLGSVSTIIFNKPTEADNKEQLHKLSFEEYNPDIKLIGYPPEFSNEIENFDSRQEIQHAIKTNVAI